MLREYAKLATPPVVTIGCCLERGWTACCDILSPIWWICNRDVLFHGFSIAFSVQFMFYIITLIYLKFSLFHPESCRRIILISLDITYTLTAPYKHLGFNKILLEFSFICWAGDHLMDSRALNCMLMWHLLRSRFFSYTMYYVGSWWFIYNP